MFNLIKKKYGNNRNIIKIIDSQKFVKTFLYDAILRKKDLNIRKLAEAGLKNDNLRYIKNITKKLNKIYNIRIIWIIIFDLFFCLNSL